MVRTTVSAVVMARSPLPALPFGWTEMFMYANFRYKLIVLFFNVMCWIQFSLYSGSPVISAMICTLLRRWGSLDQKDSFQWPSQDAWRSMAEHITECYLGTWEKPWGGKFTTRMRGGLKPLSLSLDERHVDNIGMTLNRINMPDNWLHLVNFLEKNLRFIFSGMKSPPWR